MDNAAPSMAVSLRSTAAVVSSKEASTYTCAKRGGNFTVVTVHKYSGSHVIIM